MSNKITNNLKVHGESTTQKHTDTQYANDNERINGSQPGTPISSRLINTSLRQATLVTSAFIEALKSVIPNDNDLANDLVVGVNTTFEQLRDGLIDGLKKIKVANSVLADNVKSGAIVEETNRAREAKLGYGISRTLKDKLNFVGGWVGTYRNNDVIYYNVNGANKGFYVVQNLGKESVDTNGVVTAAEMLTISAGQTPSAGIISPYLRRITYETLLSMDSTLSKTNNVNASSTTNQLLSAKGAYDNLQPKLAKHTSVQNKILARGLNDGEVSELDRTTTLNASSKDTEIPGAKAVYDYISSHFNSKLPSTQTPKLLTDSVALGTFGRMNITQDNDLYASVNNLSIPTNKAVYDFVGFYFGQMLASSVSASDTGRPPTGKAVYDYVEEFKVPLFSTDVIIMGGGSKGKFTGALRVDTISESDTRSNIPTSPAVLNKIKEYSQPKFTVLSNIAKDVVAEGSGSITINGIRANYDSLLIEWRVLNSSGSINPNYGTITSIVKVNKVENIHTVMHSIYYTYYSSDHEDYTTEEAYIKVFCSANQITFSNALKITNYFDTSNRKKLPIPISIIKVIGVKY